MADPATPSQVSTRVLRTSKGPVVHAGDRLGVFYAGTLVDGGQPFDANYDFTSFTPIPGRKLFVFGLGSGQVITGWDQALVGHRLGEVLELTIPADLAYGSTGSPPSIPPNAPLRFQVALIGALHAGSTQPSYPSYADLGVSKTVLAQLTKLGSLPSSTRIGLDGDDVLTGTAERDLLIGLAGNDQFIGAGGPDLLIGGPGANRFVYTAISDSPVGAGDRLLGFNRASDQIDLTALPQPITYIGKHTFSGQAGELRFARGTLHLDSDGDRQADLEILLPGVNRFSSANLLV